MPALASIRLAGTFVFSPRREEVVSIHLTWRSHLLVAATLLALVFPGSHALAAGGDTNSHAGKWVSNLCCTPPGTQASISNPQNAEVVLTSGDVFLSSVVADDHPSGGPPTLNLIQQGVTYEYNAPEGPSCSLGNGVKALYYFAETDVNGFYSCWNEGYANWGETHLHTVANWGLGTTWYAYRDNVYLSVSHPGWSRCSGNACRIWGWGEETAAHSGCWPAKFAGTGSTPWQRYINGQTGWFTIQSASSFADPYWYSSGPFPAGIWQYYYRRGTCP